MRKYLWDKANYFLMNDQIKIISETDHSISLVIGFVPFIVNFIYKNHKLTWTCSCHAGSVNQTCAHQKAADTYLTLNKKWLKNSLPDKKKCSEKLQNLPAENATEKKDPGMQNIP